MNSPRAYYNENNSDAANALRRLIAADVIPTGDVDERSIEDVAATDLNPYRSCHFFAGIGCWPYALRLAGWPDNRPVWTGSCPCQPFSKAGKGGGFADERHLWPSWHWLIDQQRPCVIFGEQTESPDGLMWLDLVASDLEACGYACGPVVFPSAGIGAPNIRERLWWVADSEGRRRGIDRILSQAPGLGQDAGQPALGNQDAVSRLGDAERAGLSHAGAQDLSGSGRRQEGREPQSPSGPFRPWRDLEWLDCTDGKRRPTQPGIFPLAARHPGDVAIIRAAGNAVNPEVAAEVIRTYMDIRP
jgi:DNA (cytosine-5)-methyltransferase 1